MAKRAAHRLATSGRAATATTSNWSARRTRPIGGGTASSAGRDGTRNRWKSRSASSSISRRVGGGPQEIAHLPVGGLAEVPVRLPYREERRGRGRADHLVGVVLQLATGGPGRGRYRDDDPGRPQPVEAL